MEIRGYLGAISKSVGVRLQKRREAVFLLFSLVVKGQSAICDCVRWAECLDTPRSPVHNQGNMCWRCLELQRKCSILQRVEYVGVPRTSQPHLPRPAPHWARVTSNNSRISRGDCLSWSPMAGMLSLLPGLPAVWPQLLCLGWAALAWGGAPSSCPTGRTSSGAESVGSGGFSLTRHGSEENRTMKETSQDICTPLQEGLRWEGPGMEQAVLGKGCPHKNPAYLSWVLATRAPYSPLGREGVPLSSRQRT